VSSIWEVLDLVARWIHVIAGIMWVGNSLLFNWLDRSLVKTAGPGQTAKPVGKIWLLHSGGFYYVEKTLLDDEKMPERVHWFMWQAYTTWISGALLLIIVYYAGGRAVMADPTVADLAHWQAVLIGIGAIFLGRTIYDAMQRLAQRSPTVATAIWMIALTGIAIALTQLLNGRAAFLHVGAMLGTIMAGNVGSTIVPSQKDLVAAVNERRGTSQEISDKAKRVSIHNNYFTFPVIVLMLVSHFPSIYGHRWNWLLLLVLVAGGAAVRHALNIRWTYAAWKPALAGAIAATVIATWAILNVDGWRSVSSVSSVSSVTSVRNFEEVRHIVDRRCGVCHSARPTDISAGRTPAGIMFDTPQQIMMHAARINERAVVTRTMPPANKTGITDDERAIIGRWIAAGATVD
jgi:uncharacterized membrane protein